MARLIDASDRKSADAESVREDDDNCAGGEVGFHGGQIGDEYVRLGFGSSIRPTQEDDAGKGRAAGSEEFAEIGVGRYEHSVVLDGSCHDSLIGCAQQIQVAEVYGVVSGVGEHVT